MEGGIRFNVKRRDRLLDNVLGEKKRLRERFLSCADQGKLGTIERVNESCKSEIKAHFKAEGIHVDELIGGEFRFHWSE